ncbi:hypothetical protein COO60DRAFT_1697805 [Scenedesmus sp. NREL 46B-D3]|nr:hypothetical protein COO60DRAFT_1697805 [Scenedesmus sp. NREL 46B-D3]
MQPDGRSSLTIIEECARREDSVLQLGREGQLQVLPSLPTDAPCPALDIALRGGERGVGICTDAALYVMHANARIIPLLQASGMQQYSTHCANRTARMFLESMYHDWHSPPHRSLHLMQVNNEHMFKQDEPQHLGIDLFLCKTRFCFRLMQQHIKQRNWNSSVWYTGHTSSDVLVGTHQQQQQQQQLPWRRQQRPAAKQQAAEAKAAAEPAAAGQDQQRNEATQAAAEEAAYEAAAAITRSKDATAAQQVAVEQAAAAAHYAIEESEVAAPAGHSAETPSKPAVHEPAAAELPPPPPAAAAAPALPGARSIASQRAMLSKQHEGRAAAESSSGIDMLVDGLNQAAELRPEQQKQQQPQPQQQPRALHSVQRRPQSISAALKQRTLISFEDVRALQTSIGLDICPSEREGFGHYLNEARAAGAFVMTTDHPPMNELVLPDFGKVLSIPEEDRSAKGRAARKQYLVDKRMFVRKLRRLRRQVPELPNGTEHLNLLLRHVDKLKAQAAGASGKQKAAYEAYLNLSLVDLLADAWQQRKKMLEQSLDVTVAQGRSSHTSHLSQKHMKARLALSGCGYLRIEAANNLAKQLHLLLDCQGFEPTIDVAALPQPHMVGLNFAQILQQGLGLDLTNPQVWIMPEERLRSMQGISADAYYSIISSDAALSGDCWIFDYWSNSASLAPAPFAKFGTCQLKVLLTPEAVLGSLENGVWGRAMLAAAAEAGLTPHVPAQKKVAVTAGAGSVGGASAWLYLQAQLAETMQQDGGQMVRHLALAAVVAAMAVLQIFQQLQ